MIRWPGIYYLISATSTRFLRRGVNYDARIRIVQSAGNTRSCLRKVPLFLWPKMLRIIQVANWFITCLNTSKYVQETTLQCIYRYTYEQLYIFKMKMFFILMNQIFFRHSEVSDSQTDTVVFHGLFQSNPILSLFRIFYVLKSIKKQYIIITYNYLFKET